MLLVQCSFFVNWSKFSISDQVWECKVLFFWLHSDNKMLIVNGVLADVGSCRNWLFYANVFYRYVHFDTCRWNNISLRLEQHDTAIVFQYVVLYCIHQVGRVGQTKLIKACFLACFVVPGCRSVSMECIDRKEQILKFHLFKIKWFSYEQKRWWKLELQKKSLLCSLVCFFHSNRFKIAEHVFHTYALASVKWMRN